MGQCDIPVHIRIVSTIKTSSLELPQDMYSCCAAMYGGARLAQTTQVVLCEGHRTERRSHGAQTYCSTKHAVII